MQTNHFISTDELASILDDPKVKVLDCSVTMFRKPGDCSKLAFHKNHIKKAQFLDLEMLKDNKSDYILMMPD